MVRIRAAILTLSIRAVAYLRARARRVAKTLGRFDDEVLAAECYDEYVLANVDAREKKAGQRLVREAATWATSFATGQCWAAPTARGANHEHPDF